MKKAAMYEEEFEKMREVMMSVFFDKAVGSWFDVNSESGAHHTDFYASNLAPLYTGCYSFSDEAAYDKLVQYFLVGVRWRRFGCNSRRAGLGRVRLPERRAGQPDPDGAAVGLPQLVAAAQPDDRGGLREDGAAKAARAGAQDRRRVPAQHLPALPEHQLDVREGERSEWCVWHENR